MPLSQKGKIIYVYDASLQPQITGRESPGNLHPVLVAKNVAQHGTLAMMFHVEEHGLPSLMLLNV